MKKTSPDGDYFLRFYLHSDPFPTGDRDRLLYLTPELERRLQRVVTLLAKTDQLVVITGAGGAGKSTVAARLAEELAEDWSVATVRAQRHWEVETLAGALIEGLSPKEIAGLAPVTRVYKFLEHCDRHKVAPLIIVDDAHRLEDRPLEFLLQIAGQSYNQTRLRFVLLGSDGLPERIEDAKVLAADSVAVVHLPAFSGEQTAEYIDHRLAACGLEGDGPMDRGEIARIHRISGGLPGGIHHLARQTLIAAAAGRRQSRGRGAAALLLLLAAGAAAYLYISDYRLSWGEPPRAPAPVAVAPAEHRQPVKETAPMPDPVPAAPEHPESAEVLPVREDEEVEAPVPAEAFADLPAATPIQGDSPVPVLPEPERASPDPEPEKSATAALAPAAPPPDAAPVPQSVDPGWRAGLRGPDWIREQPDGTHFLQLINASDADNAARLLQRLTPVRADLAAYTNYTPSGRPRYLVLYGVYPDRAAAEAAIPDLPDVVRAIPPWPRARAGVLTDMDSAEARDLAP